MARPLRIEYEGAFYHVIARGNEKRLIFEDNRDFSKFLQVITLSLERHGVRLHCFVLMPNHYHLLIETPNANLTAFMHNLQTHYTGYFNFRHDRVGHLFQGRYKALLVQKEEYLMELSRYIHLNPVRAELVPRPEQWRWSSYCAYTQKKCNYKELIYREDVLSYFGKTSEQAMRQYKIFVNNAIDQEGEPELPRVTAQLIIGDDSFVTKIKSMLEEYSSKSDSTISSIKELFQWTEHQAEKAIERIADEFEVDKQEILEKGHHNNVPRDMAMWAFYNFSKWQMKDIGTLFGVSGSAIVHKIKSIETLSDNDKEFKQTREKISVQIEQMGSGREY